MTTEIAINFFSSTIRNDVSSLKFYRQNSSAVLSEIFSNLIQ